MTAPQVMPGYVEFLALNSNGTVRCPLPDVETWTLSPLLNDAGALSLTYPATGVNFEVLRENVTQDKDLNVRVVVDGIVRPQLQGILAESSGDDVDPDAMWSFSGNFTEQWLTEAQVVPNGGQPSQQTTEGENDTHFYSCTAGTILRTLLQEAVDRGVLTNLVWSSFSNTTDSVGVAFSEIITLKFSPGLTFLQVAQALVEYGMCEFEMVGNELRVYNGESHSVDRTLTQPPVVFRAGRDLTDSPRKHSVRDTATTLLVAGGEGKYHTITDATALANRGRKIESFASQKNITDQGTLVAFTQHALTGLVTGSMEKSHGLAIVDGPRPLDNFDVGDWAWSDAGRGLERLRIKQWMLTGDNAGKIGGTVVLNDLFAEGRAALVRRIKGIEGGSTVIGTSQARPVPTALVDKIGPKAPIGVVVNSLAYEANGIIESAASAQWDPVTLNSDNTAIDDLDYYLLQWRYTNPAKANMVNGLSMWKLGGMPTDPYFSWSGLAPGEQIEVRVGARDKAGNYAPFSAITLHTLASDTVAPPTPSTPVTSTLFGSIRIEWNGLGSAGQAMPPDFLRTEVHASQQSGFTPSGATLYTTMSGAGVTSYSAAAYGVTMFFRFVAVDRSGNASGPSAQASGTARQAVTLDLGPGAVERSNIKVAAIGSAEIGTAVINNLHVADVSVGKLTAGTLSADVVIGANFATALTGGRVGFDPQGFFAYSPLNVQTVRISNDGSAMLMGEIRTRETGARFVFNPGGTAPTELRVYPDTGSTNYTKLKAGTVTDAFSNQHSVLQIVASRYQNDVGEPVLEMYGGQGQLTWTDSTGATGAAGLKSYIRVDRYKTSIGGGRVDLNLLDTAQGTPNNYVKIAFYDGNSIEFRKSQRDAEPNIRSSNTTLALWSIGFGVRNASDLSYREAWATAWNVTSGRPSKRNERPISFDVLAAIDTADPTMWEYLDSDRTHLGPMAENLPTALRHQSPGGEGVLMVNPADLAGLALAGVKRLRAELRRVEGLINTRPGGVP